MDSVRSDRTGSVRRIPLALKILIAGGFGAGKTTLVGAVSEIRPLQTEEVLTDAGVGTDDLAGVEDKTTTTVAMDFGRITINEDLQVYLFGTPGQDRFWFLWDELALGALGAVVLADTRRLADCFPSVDYFEQRGTPFVVGGQLLRGRAAVQPRLGPASRSTSTRTCRWCSATRASRQSGKDVLITLVEHVAHRRGVPVAAP